MADTEIRTRPSHVLEDPSAKAVAHVYAVSFLDAAAAANKWDALAEFTSFNDDVLKANPEFAKLLTSQMTSKEDKLGMIERVAAPAASAFFTNFLRVLARHERLDLMELILSETWLEHEKRSNQKRVQVTSAVPLSEEQLGRIKDRLKSSLSFDPILIPEVDQELLGGLVIHVGDTVFDGSLRTKLRNLRVNLRERYLHEIQSGRDRFRNPEGN